MTYGQNVDCWMIYPTVQQVPLAASGSVVTSPWPSNTCLIAPGVFEPMNGYRYDLSAMPEGVVATFGCNMNQSPPWYSGSRLVLSKSIGGDPYALAKSLSIMLGYGIGSDGASPQSALYQARLGAVFGLCGSLALWYQEAFKERGYQVRSCVTSDLVKNGWDDGHVLFEVFINGQWRLFCSYGHYFTDNSGRHLSFYEVFLAGPQNCQLVHLRNAPWPAYFTEPSNIFNSAQLWPARAFADLYTSTDEKYVAWLQRVLGVPAMQVNGGAITGYMPSGGSTSLQTQLQATGFTFITQQQWASNYYPGNGVNC